ncbi:MAG: class I SAM-dependent methyltransferase [Pseudomonadota bacterium]
MAKQETKTIRKQLSDWFISPLGQQVMQLEKQQMEEVLPELFGYHILQIGKPASEDYIDSSKISHKAYLCLDEHELIENGNTIQSLAEHIPIASDSIDVAVLPHVFEYSKDPHRLLRELDRVLIDDGHIVIIGINRFSLWGLWHVILCWWDKIPWNGRLISIPRMKDWFALLDFEVKKVRYCFYAPPFRKTSWQMKFKPLERLGAYCWPFLGGIYVIVGKKRVVPLTPIKMQWKTKKKIIGSGVAEPTTREGWQRRG